jgi:outer membrane lipoprotein-sorting protein
MKKKIKRSFQLTILLAVILVLSGLSITSFAQFTGDMVFNKDGQEKQFKVYSAEAGYRYDFEENGSIGAIIVRSGSKDVIVLMPDQKMAMKNPGGSAMSMNSDPLQAFEKYEEEGTLKEEGEETINGIVCTKSTLWSNKNPGQKIYTVWVSEEYKFPMKMIDHMEGSEGSGMEMKNVEHWTPDKSKFEIPQGYQTMGMPGI